MSGASLNPLLSERARLLIMATLAASENDVEFVGLLDATGLTKGNMSAHIKKLEEAGFLEVVKEFVERKPLTRYRCTEFGRAKVKEYLREVEKMLKGL